MSAIKITPADKAFSDCIRERAAWTCERCGRECPPDKRQGLHCSHFHGRGRWGTRFDPDNCEALCYGCHMYLTANPSQHTHRHEERVGPYTAQALREKSLNSAIGRQAKREQAEIAKHYRGELKWMQRVRASGVTGRIEFTGYL